MMNKPKFILFLDKDNTLLSAAAEQVFRRLMEDNDILNITIASAGETHLGFITRDEGMNAVMGRDNLCITGIVNPLSQGLLIFADWVVCMDDESINYHQICRIDKSTHRILDFPRKDLLTKLVREYPPDYEHIYLGIKEGCNDIMQELKNSL